MSRNKLIQTVSSTTWLPAAVTALLLFGSALVAQEPAAPQPAAPEQAGETGMSSTRVDLRIHPLMDLWLSSRAHARQPEDAPEELRPLARAMHGLTPHIQRGWGFLEGNLNNLHNTEEMVELLGEVKTLRGRRGDVDIRAEMAAIADAWNEVEPVYRERIWPKRSAKLQATRQYLTTTFAPIQGRAFHYMLSSLEIDDPGIAIPVYLVSRVPYPGAKTYQDRDGQGFSVVSVDLPTLEGTVLAETVLHEATHVLDMASDSSVLIRLRDRLKAEGLSFRDAAYHDLPHTLMFVQAGETIRRFLDPKHKPYGDRLTGDGKSTYYQRAFSGEMQRDLWLSRLEGKTTREEVVRRLIAAAKKDGPSS